MVSDEPNDTTTLLSFSSLNWRSEKLQALNRCIRRLRARKLGRLKIAMTHYHGRSDQLLIGASGAEYLYFRANGKTWSKKATAGNVAFIGTKPDGTFDVIYVAEAENGNRLGMLAFPEAVTNYDATLRLFHRNDNADARKREVLDLIARYEPIKNRPAGATRDIVLLDQLRRELNHVPKLIEVRTDLVRLICEASDSAEKTAALADAIEYDRDSLGPVRLAAPPGLAEAAQRGDRQAAVVLQRAVSSASLSKTEQRSVRQLLAQIDRGVPLARAAPAPVAPAVLQPPSPVDPALEAAAQVSQEASPHQETKAPHDAADAEFEVAAERLLHSAPRQAAYAQAAMSQSLPRRRSRTQTAMEWTGLVAFALVGAGWIYFWQNCAAFDR